MKEAYRGELVRLSNGEEDDLTGLRGEGVEYILAEEIQHAMNRYGQYLSVRYFISDVPLSEEELTLELVKMVCGYGEVSYGMCFSEDTGYLWTNEDLMVGGHDLLGELGGHIGKYLHLEIEYSKTENPNIPQPGTAEYVAWSYEPDSGYAK